MIGQWYQTYLCRVYCLLVLATVLFVLLPAVSDAKTPSDAEIDKQIKDPDNSAIIETFLKYELNEVNENATKPMLKQHPSLVFFVNQAERGPLKNLFFLERWVHELRKAQRNIDSLPYSIAFSSEERKRILSLKPTADRIVSYGIPLMKRDFYRVLTSAKELAEKKKKPAVELLPGQVFRDEVYRHAEPVAERLDKEMGELSEGELVCMQLGWVLEQVTLTKLWLVFNDNKLPRRDDYMAFRKKRSEYWQKRLSRIHKQDAVRAGTSGPKAGK